jgi:hypothetical protein
MNTLQLNIEKSQLISLLETMDVPDKMEIYDILKKSLMGNRLDDLFDAFEINEQKVLNSRFSEIS